MDPRRRLKPMVALAAAALAACAHGGEPTSPPAASAAPDSRSPLVAIPALPPSGSPNGGPIPYTEAWGATTKAAPAATPERHRGRDARRPTAVPDRAAGPALRTLAYAPDRVFAVRAAPLRVTALALEPGESLIDKAAGDTVRWQIGETTSGAGEERRTLVLIKPMSAGLSTNMVLTTSRRVYLLDLASAAGGHDPAISWSYPAGPADAAPQTSAAAPLQVSASRYRIDPEGRAPDWTPAAVLDDGVRTYIALPPGVRRTPVLLMIDRRGRPALANYRLVGAVLVVDRLFDAAELRLGEGRSAVVRITRIAEERRP